MISLNKKCVVPKLVADVKEKRAESDLWYLDNDASNHLTGQKSKFKDLDEEITR